MSKHEFYADPTLFDHWQSSAGNWLSARGEKVSPYGWVIAFASLGCLLLAVSFTVLGVSLHDTVNRLDTVWSRQLAQGVVAIVALAAAQALFRLALEAWPGGIRIPRAVLRAARYVGWRPARPVRGNAALCRHREREAVQAFFTGVREAGVNVTIARALFSAGIRSPQQLRRANDRQLAAIRGVGPATIGKLRARFGSVA
jgi:hypothetical protein